MRRTLRALLNRRAAAAARLLRRVGRRGACLLFLALVDVVYAISLYDASPETRASSGFAFMSTLLPLSAWAAVWLAVGALCVGFAFARADRLAFAAASLLKVLWGTLYLLGWALGVIPRGYVAAVLFLGFAGFVQVIAGWKEHRTEWTSPSTSR
jgi:hypothetical protein